MNQISTISELLHLSDSSYRIFDIGRTVTKIPKQQFEQVEQAMQPYPFPTQGHAFIAIVFWQKHNTTPFLWFVKLPLDERGLLNQAARNHFIAIILEALGEDLTQDPSDKQEELLKNNPYHFTPAQYKLAALNAIIKRDFKQKASSYYEHCQLYFSGQIGFDNWQGVGVQGLCDFAARVNVTENEVALLSAIEHLPEQVFSPLCSALESQTLDYKVITKFCELGLKTLDAPSVDQAKLANIIRALGANAEHPSVIDLISKTLNCETIAELSVLVTISGRCWLALVDIDILLAFLEKLVESQNQDVFVSVFQDLIALPSIRGSLLQCIRLPNRSPALVNALGQLFSQVKGN